MSPAARISLPSDPTAPGLARRFLAGFCRPGDSEVRDDAALLVTEVVTNAVLHGAPTIELEIRRVGEAMLEVRVRDGRIQDPRPRPASVDAESGRGLILVDTLSDDWGSIAGMTGKTVWFRVGAAGEI